MADNGDRVSTLEERSRADATEIARIKVEIGEMRRDVAALKKPKPGPKPTH